MRTINFGDSRLPQRFWDKATRADAGCWVWTATINRNGYGQIRDGGPMHMAHRVSYGALVGAIPEGAVLDHLCRNRACVNPAHLEAVTNRVNVLRGDSIPAANAVKATCPQGHPYDAVNTYVDGLGKRSCRICRRAADARYKARRRARLALPQITTGGAE